MTYWYPFDHHDHHDHHDLGLRWSKGRSEGDPSQSNQMLDPNFLHETEVLHHPKLCKQSQIHHSRYHLYHLLSPPKSVHCHTISHYFKWHVSRRCHMISFGIPEECKAWFDGNDWWTHAEADAQWKRHRNLRELPNAASTGGQHSDAFGTEMSPFFSHFTLLFSVAALYSSLYFPTPHKFIKKTYITKISQKTKDSQCWNSLSM